MSTTTDDKWLRLICDRTRADSERYSFMAAPHSLSRGREKWAVATDGRMAACILGYGGYDVVPERAPQSLGEALWPTAPLGAAFSTELARLRTWAGDAPDRSWGPCEECGGATEVECPECYSIVKCCHCGGLGDVQDNWPARPGRIAGVPFDRSRLAYFLHHITAEDVAVTVRAKTLIIVAGMYRFVLIGLDPELLEEPCEEYEVEPGSA